jgi:hypothetical protein
MRLILILLLLTVPAICSAEIYKWVDDKGQIGFADDLGKVPAKYRDKALVTEKQEQAIEIIEKAEPEKTPRQGGEGAAEKGEDKSKNKAKALFGGKDGPAWKLEFAKQRYEIKALEDQAAGVRERMADGSKISRGDFLSLQATQRDLDIRINKAKQKLDALTTAADNAEVPAEFR